MKRENKAFRSFAAIMAAGLVMGSCLTGGNTACLAADNAEKADLGAISGFGKNYTVDKDGKFEMDGVMVSAGSVYNITVDGEAIQAWSGNYKSRTWKDKELIKLLNDPTTFFYEKVSGTPDKAEFTNKVEFARPNGETQ